MDLSRLSGGQRMIVVAGMILMAVLVLFPWHDFGFSAAAMSHGHRTPRAVQSPGAAFGAAAFFVTFVMVVHILVNEFSSGELPKIGATGYMLLGFLVLGLLMVKLATEPGDLAVAAFIGLAMAALVALGGFTMKNEATRGRPRY